MQRENSQEGPAHAQDDFLGDAVDEDLDSEADSEDKQFEEAVHAVRRNQIVILCLCMLQLAQCCVILWAAETTRNAGEQPQLREFFNGVVGIFGSLIGIYAAIRKSEIAKLFLIIQLWMLATNSTFMYTQVSNLNQITILCRDSQSYSFTPNSEYCTTVEKKTVAKLVLACTGLFLTIVTCLTSFNYTNKLDDYFDHLQSNKLMMHFDDEDE